MADCINCANSVFNEDWGEYKCKIFKKTIYDPTKISCTAHKPKDGKEKKT